MRNSCLLIVCWVLLWIVWALMLAGLCFDWARAKNYTQNQQHAQTHTHTYIKARRHPEETHRELRWDVCWRLREEQREASVAANSRLSDSRHTHTRTLTATATTATATKTTSTATTIPTTTTTTTDGCKLRDACFQYSDSDLSLIENATKLCRLFGPCARTETVGPNIRAGVLELKSTSSKS